MSCFKFLKQKEKVSQHILKINSLFLLILYVKAYVPAQNGGLL